MPPVTAQESEDKYTHLYGHVYTIMRDGSGYADSVPSPMNTMAPAGENDFSRGGTAGTVYVESAGNEACLAPDTGAVVIGVSPVNCDPVYDLATNEAWFFAYNDVLPFGNEAEYLDQGGLASLHSGKQLLKDIQLDQSVPLTADFWMSADATAWFPWYKGCAPALVLCPVDDEAGDEPLYQDLPWPYPLWNADYGVFPNWVIQSKAYAVSTGFLAAQNITGVPNAIIDIETGAAEDAEGVTLISEGVSAPIDMMSLPSSTGQEVIYRLTPEMSASSLATIPRDSAIFWWVDWYADHGEVKALYSQNFAVNSGEFFPPRLSLPITNPMDIEMVMPQFTEGGKMVIIALFNSPFGAYDVPLDAARLEIIDPSGQVIATHDDKTVTWMQKAAREQQSLLGVSPEAALARGQATWLWNYLKEESIKPGDYTIRVYAENQQGRAAYKEAFFTIEEGLVAGAVTSSLGGMFTFTKEDIKALEECHGCHDPQSGDLLEGVQNVTRAEAMQQLATEGSGNDEGSKDTPAPGISAFSIIALAAVALRRRRL